MNLPLLIVLHLLLELMQLLNLLAMKSHCVTLARCFDLSTDDLMTQDGELHVQQSGAVLNQDTDQWSIQLTCGLFIFRDSPPFYVEWTVS